MSNSVTLVIFKCTHQQQDGVLSAGGHGDGHGAGRGRGRGRGLGRVAGAAGAQLPLAAHAPREHLAWKTNSKLLLLMTDVARCH